MLTVKSCVLEWHLHCLWQGWILFLLGCYKVILLFVLHYVVMVAFYHMLGTFSQEVVFAAGAADQTTTVTIPITDNEIALEDDVVRRFGLRDVSTNLVTIGNPSETSLTIIDDDSELTCYLVSLVLLLFLLHSSC